MSPVELYRIEKARHDARIAALLEVARVELDGAAPVAPFLKTKSGYDAAYYEKHKARIRARQKERRSKQRAA